MQEYEEKIAKLKKIIGESGNIVFFGGAGVSTESGIPDFRSRDGLYHEEYDYPPETIVSHEFFMGNTAEFYRFYKRKMLFPHAEPNACHLALARLEGRENSKRWSRRISTDCIRRRAVSLYSSFTAASGAIFARNAKSRFPWRRLLLPTECHAVPAAGSSSRTWCCTEKCSTTASWREP